MEAQDSIVKPIYTAQQEREMMEARLNAKVCDDPPSAMKTFASGAKSTVEKPWYHLVPRIAMELIAERFAYGAKRHGERNYRKGANDPAFIRDRVNHLVEHVLNYAETMSREDLSAIGCNFAILADLGAYEGSEQRRTQAHREELERMLDAIERERSRILSSLHDSSSSSASSGDLNAHIAREKAAAVDARLRGRC